VGDLHPGRALPRPLLTRGVPLYGSYTCYVTGVLYTAATTTVTLTMIARTTVFTSPTFWALVPPDEFSPGGAMASPV
jgi:hypothetical protein